MLINIIITTVEIEPEVVLLKPCLVMNGTGFSLPHIKAGGTHWKDKTARCFIRPLSHMEDDGFKLFSLIASLLFMLANPLIPLI